MTRLEIDWPDAAAERVRAAEGRLRVAGEALRARSFEERLAAVAGVVGEWTRADSPWRRELAHALAEATPFAAPTVREGLDSALRAWRPEAFVACAEREIGASLVGGARRLAPFEWTTVIAGGALPMPTILSALLPLVVGSPVLLRETSKDPVTARLVARSLALRDPGLASAFEPIAFPADDAVALDAALTAPCVVASGADETLAAIAARLRPAQRFVGYGHRFSIGVIGPALDDDATRAAARGLALDVARWDQSGCLSPVVVYAVGFTYDAARRFARALADEMERVARELPRGELAAETHLAIAHERAAARMREDAGPEMLFEGTDHTVVLVSDARARPAPLGRFLQVLPVPSLDALDRALAPFTGHLSSVCLAGFAEVERAAAPGRASDLDPEWRARFDRLKRLGVSRFTRPGHLQTPPIDWPHDGLPLFTPMTRFSSEAEIGL